MRKFKKLTMTLVALFALTTGAWAQEVTKIAVGGSTQNNNYVPLPGNLAQNYTKCEFVYPATMLTALNGYDIKRMTFGAAAGNQNWGDARFQVFLKEVDFTTISAYSGTDNATTVYEGELYLFGTHEMEITFTIPYTYHGGNLLIGVYQTVKGNRGGLPQWLGENATGASVRGSNSSSLDAVTTATQCNFLPKVTFTCVSSAAEPEAQENVTIIFNDLGLDNAYDLTTASLTVGNIELNFAQNNGLNPPKFYTTDGGTARIYTGNSMSISAGGATITKIVFNLTQGTPTFNTGSYNATTSTWEGEATTLTLSNEMASGQVRITSMDVYYSVASAAGEAAYTVTLKEGTDDADNWTITPEEAKTTGVAEGTEITATYSGTKRVKSVKAVKKAEPKPAAEATAEDKGKVIGTDGKIYADVEAATAAGTTAVAKIIYIGTTGHATYSHGLALALTDEASKMAWEAAIDACSAKNTSTPVTGATWLLASKDQWDYMLGTDGAGSHYDLRDGFSSVGGSNLQWNYYYSSTEDDSDSSYAWYYSFAYGIWLHVLKGSNNYVRACLAF